MIQINNISKKYGDHYAVKDLSFEFEEGNIYGFLGPNGAGKSTTMNMICSLLKPTAGEIQIFDMDVKKNASKVKPLIGYIPQELAIYGNLKAWENVELFTSLYDIKGKELKTSIDEALEFVELADKRDAFAKTFSGGMKRRLNIACGIAHKPELIFFDEPTVAVDPQSRNKILEGIVELIDKVLSDHENEAVIEQVKAKVHMKMNGLPLNRW